MVIQFEQLFADPRLESAVRNAWESFVRGDPEGRKQLRSLVDMSWQRCRKANVDPHRISGPTPVSDDDLVLLRTNLGDMLEASAPIMAQARDLLAETGSMMLLADTSGTILNAEGDLRTQDAAASIHLMPGANWSEALCGTNAIGTALAVEQPVQIHSSEHFCAGIKNWTCSATVVRHPLDGDIVGVVDVSGLSSSYSPQSLALAVTTASRIESRMRLNELERRYRLLEQVMGHWRSDGRTAIALFDRRGGLVKANELAQSVVLEGGRTMDLTAVRRLPALALGQGLVQARSSLPDWLKAEWLEPLQVGGKKIGTLVIIPQAAAARSSWLPPAGGSVVTGQQSDAAHSWRTPPSDNFAHVLTEDAGMREVLERAELLARSRSAVLLLGETGVGKEEFAKGIHASHGPYVALNCGGLSRELLVSELFGYGEGAFTGARKGGMTGKVEAAAGGTLFLDEIGEMPLDLQPQLLRVLEQGEYYRLGETTPRKASFRLIAATHRDLRQEVAAGRFRMDLYYRIAVTTLRIPPLRARTRDIVLLAERFLQRSLEQHGRVPGQLSVRARQTLQAYTWPGNVRELRNVIEGSVLMNLRDAVGDYDVDIDQHSLDIVTDTSSRGAEPADERIVPSMAESEEVLIARAVRASHGNFTEAARRLGIAKSTLYAKMERYGLSRGDIIGGR
ncbi:MAG: sigma-54-dependent Fis family transcriptional regulator [Brachymonas denitrificans]